MAFRKASPLIASLAAIGVGVGGVAAPAAAQKSTNDGASTKKSPMAFYKAVPLIAGLVAIGLGVAVAAAPAAAQKSTNSGASTIDDTFARFDEAASIFGAKLMTFVLRVFVDFTYDDLAYDPRTRETTLSLVSSHTPWGPVRADRIVFHEERTEIDGLTFDLENEALPPEIRGTASQIGYTTLRADAVIDSSYDFGASSVDAVIHLDVEDAGAIDIAAKVGHFRFDMMDFIMSEGLIEPSYAGEIESMHVAYEDGGLADRLINMFAEMNNAPADQARAQLGAMATQGLAELTSNAPPALQELARQAGAAATAFLKEPAQISIALVPSTPIPFADVTEIVENAEIERVGASIHLAEPRIADIAETNAIAAKADNDVDARVELGRRLLDGEGAPQNFSRARELLKPPADQGNAAAALAYARALSMGAVTSESRAQAYVFALVGAARGASGANALVSQFERAMNTKEIAAGQNAALKFWSETGGDLKGRIDAAMTGDVSAIRALASGFYRGDGAPRNYAQAYMWASIGAAAGDPISTRLRDRVLQGLDRGFIDSAQLGEAQKAASDLWSRSISSALTAKLGAGAN